MTGGREESGAGAFILLVSSLQVCHELAVSLIQWSQLLSSNYTAALTARSGPEVVMVPAHYYQPWGTALSLLSVSLLFQFVFPLTTNDALKTCFQSNQAQIAFEELDREEMENSESFDILF